jgi:hypothetical protein
MSKVNIVDEIYGDVIQKIEPFIKYKGVKSVDESNIEDAIQESRIALLFAMFKYDFNKNNDFVPYMNIVVQNIFYSLSNKSKRKKCVPYVYEKGEGGEWDLKPCKVILDTDKCDDFENSLFVNELGNSELETREALLKVALFKEEMEKHLGLREIEILNCKLSLSSGFTKYLEEKYDYSVVSPKNVDISDYLGLKKSQMDWSVHKIRKVFTSISSSEEFSEVFEEYIGNKEWPFYKIVSGYEFDIEFVNEYICKNRFTSDVLRDTFEVCSFGSRRIMEYSWGSVVVLMFADDKCYTVVVKGEFICKTGEVRGMSKFGVCVSKVIPVKGYSDLSYALEKGVDMIDNKKLDKFKVLPSCLSMYESGDSVCDGVSTPCPYRNTCVAIQLRMGLKDLRIGSYVIKKVDSNGDEYCIPKNLLKFYKIVVFTKKVYGIIGGKVTKKPKKVKSKNVKLISKEQSRAMAMLKTNNILTLDGWFIRWAEKLVTGISRTFKNHVLDAKKGQFYVRDRRDKSKYISIYCKTDRMMDKPVVSVMYKPRTCTVDVLFPIEPGEFKTIDRSLMSKLSPVSKKVGLFKSISVGLNEEKFLISCEVIIKLVEGRIIDLPEEDLR